MSWIAIACSGIGMEEVIASNERWAWYLALAAAGVAALAALFAVLERRANRWLWATVVLTGIHPGVWMSGRGGDCGTTLYFAAVAATILVVVLAVASVATRRRPSS